MMEKLAEQQGPLRPSLSSLICTAISSVWFYKKICSVLISILYFEMNFTMAACVWEFETFVLHHDLKSV